MIIIPPYLKKGNTLGLLCPAGYMPIKKATTCIQTLESWGFNVVIGKTLQGKQKNYFSGTDKERLDDFQTMLNDENIKAILCARGGYGVSRIIDDINFSKFKKNPKWIIGFSDITVFHAHINRQYKIATLHSSMAAAFNDEGFKNEYILSIKKALTGANNTYTCNAHQLNHLGTATGELIGGNLALIAHLIGSKSAYQTANKILFIEDVGEYLYNIDRMFVQLKRAGMLNNLKGLIIGKFAELKDTTSPFGATVYNIIHHHVKDYHYPICYDFPVGHVTENVALKVGVEHTLTVQKNKVTLKESTLR
ncbi:MAG: LD-carboxypeptidase [Chitinophagaceae bacterium]|nr:LD-carboxypeptidase [Chitinophagaceae bacterium]MCW5905124.1 LD-carboxypeptidase [Chitinophagaceae bacterium]